jgi:hypothetical protein
MPAMCLHNECELRSRSQGWSSTTNEVAAHANSTSSLRSFGVRRRGSFGCCIRRTTRSTDAMSRPSLDREHHRSITVRVTHVHRSVTAVLGEVRFRRSRRRADVCASSWAIGLVASFSMFLAYVLIANEKSEAKFITEIKALISWLAALMQFIVGRYDNFAFDTETSNLVRRRFL